MVKNTEALIEVATYTFAKNEIWIPCGTKFLREFNFADWRFFFFLFCFTGTNFCDWENLFSCWELLFAIFWMSRSKRNDNSFVLFEHIQKKDG